MLTIEPRLTEAARVLWDYHAAPACIPRRADFALVMGSHDDRVALHAAQLMLGSVAPIAITSGGYGKVTEAERSESEGERFKAIMINAGVAPDKILTETEATNSGDNFVLSREQLKLKHIDVNSGVIVTKPYMARRAIATGEKQWAGVQWMVSIPQIDFLDYPTEDVPEERMIELMVGDLQRIDLYSRNGFQSPQDIPATAWKAYDVLVEAGYDKYVVRPR